MSEQATIGDGTGAIAAATADAPPRSAATTAEAPAATAATPPPAAAAATDAAPPAAASDAAAPAAATTTPHGEAWGALTRTHAAVTQRLQEALAQGDYPPLPWYEVMAAVAEAPDQRLRMGDLAEILVITRGRLTKLVDRLVKAGLLDRTFCESDRRVSYATLCPAGKDLLAEMRPVVVRELEVAFSANISEGEAGQLTETLDRVRGSACGTGSA